MDRTERLLDLVALLLAARGPITWEKVREVFPDEYGGAQETALRKFERDKAELLELGIPLTWVESTDEATEGYVLDREAYYLPEPGLAADELAVLYAAGSAALESGAFPGRRDLAHALRKIAFFSDGPVPAPKVRLELGAGADPRELPARLETLWGAINARKSVDLEYYSPHSDGLTRRTVDPWGLALRRGAWHLVGHCHLRDALRTFQVQRMRSLTVNPARPRSPDFEVPADFRLDEHVAAWPWQHRIHPPLQVEVRLQGELAPLAKSLFGDALVTPADRGVSVSVRATDLDGLLRYVLSQGDEARVTGPAAAVARASELAAAVLRAHGGTP
jgi:proteasome accessory factor B